MENMEISLMQENQNLKSKCNKLLDIIEDLTGKIKVLEEQILSLEKEGGNEIITNQANYFFDENDMLYAFMESLRRVIQKVVQDNAFIQYSNQSKNSILYYKIEKETFEKYIEEFALISKKKFVELCAQMQFLKSEKNYKCVYNSDALRVYFIGRAVVELVYEMAQVHDQEV